MKKFVILFLAFILIIISFSVTAVAEDGWTIYRPILGKVGLKPGELLAADGPVGYAGVYFPDEPIDTTHGDWWVLQTASQSYQSWEFVIEGTGIEFDGTAQITYEDGSTVVGIREFFADGERITLTFDQDKAGMKAEGLILFRVVENPTTGHLWEVWNGVAQRRDLPFFSNPDTPSIRTGAGSIADIFYTDADGNDRIRPNPNLDNPPTPTEQPSSWAIGEVSTAIETGLTPQSLQSKYAQTITRVEYCALAVMLYEKYTGKEIDERKTFIDTSDVNIAKMAAVGVVEGVGENKFDPDGILNREQAATMLSRLANALGKPLPILAAAFADNGNISSWAIQSAGQVQAAGIMTGVGNNTFDPKSPYTREQSIITMIRL